MKTILVIDDESSVRQSYRMTLADTYRVVLAENGKVGLATLERVHVDLILLDLIMPEMTGMEFLDHLVARGDTTPVIVVTATNSVNTAVAAMKRGARDFVIKPFDVDEVRLLVERILTDEQNKNELTALREAGKGTDALIGGSPPFQDALEMAGQAMQVDSTVLITGESGTGKDMLARAVHYGGKRAKHAFVAISCCAIPAQLFESELFGHEKGAFTGAIDKRIGKMQVADRGTLFLDEIGEMPLEAQAKLLRVLQDGSFYPLGSNKLIEVDVRIVCATNRNLPEAVAKGMFRQDLFYRINVLPIEMPPLRRRREDIPTLTQHFIAKHGPRINSKVTGFDSDAMAMLNAYSWPGNVREMENTIERILVCFRNRSVISPDCLRGILTPVAPENGLGLAEFEGLPLEEAVNRIERHLITRALERNGMVQSRAADALGTTRRILKYKMDQLGIEGPKNAEDEAV